MTGYKLKYAKEGLELNYTLKATGENITVSDVAILDLFRRNNSNLGTRYRKVKGESL